MGEHEGKPVLGRGEVCIRGTVMNGYYQQEDKTKEAVEENGWFHSNDIGCWLPNGTLKIIDRKNNIWKLSQGEYVSPEKIENILCRSNLVAQCFIHGTPNNSCVIGVVVPDAEVIGESLEKIQNDKDVKQKILDSMVETGRANGLRGFELPKDIYLTHEPFSVDNKVLTPTFKMLRKNARELYAEHLRAMYDKLG